MIRRVDPELVELLNQARNDPEAVALVLFGSAASGSTHEVSDVDVFYVRRGEPLPKRERRGRLEIVPTTLDLLRAAPDWLKPALAYAQVIWDETGEVESVLAAARTISHDETAELYDGYLNDFYRSMKAWRTGNELAGRIECGRSLRYLGELVFALDGIRAPYPKEWHGKLGELEPLILEVARSGAPRLQQEICAIVRDRATQRGYAHVHDRFGWAGSTRPGVPHYYRLQGRTFLLEFDNSRNSGTYIHSVWRDFERDFGRRISRKRSVKAGTGRLLSPP